MLNTRNEEYNTVFYSYLACFVKYMHLENVRMHVIYEVNQTEYVIHVIVVAPQEYVNICLTRRAMGLHGQRWGVTHRLGRLCGAQV